MTEHYLVHCNVPYEKNSIKVILDRGMAKGFKYKIIFVDSDYINDTDFLATHMVNQNLKEEISAIRVFYGDHDFILDFIESDRTILLTLEIVEEIKGVKFLYLILDLIKDFAITYIGMEED